MAHSNMQDEIFRILVLNNVMYKPQYLDELLTSLEQYVLRNVSNVADICYQDGQEAMRGRAKKVGQAVDRVLQDLELSDMVKMTDLIEQLSIEPISTIGNPVDINRIKRDIDNAKTKSS